MAIRSGIDAQIGFGPQVAYGTVLDPVTRFLEFNSETLKLDKRLLKSHAIGSGLWQKHNRINHFIAGASGDMEFDVMTKGMGLLLEHCLGSNVVAQVGATPEYTQTITPSTTGLWGKFMTVQKGLPDTANGTIRPFNLIGGKVIDWKLSVAVDGILKLMTSWDFQTAAITPAIATKSFPTGAPFIFAEGALTVGGVATAVRSFEIGGHNAQDTDRRFIGAATAKKEPIANGENTISGTMDCEFEDMDAYNAWVAGTQAALVATFTSTQGFITGSTPFKLTVTVPAMYYMGDTPTVGGPEVIRQARPFEAAYNGSAPIVTILINSSDTAS